MKADSYPLVSIISINYNSATETNELLKSLENSNYNNLEIIIVDNASSNREIENLVSVYPQVNFIMSDVNLGFAGGNNLAIREAKGEYLFFVNNDAEVTSNLFEHLLKPFYEDSTIGIVCPKIKYFYTPTIIQYAGYSKINPITGRNKTIGNKELDNGQYEKSGYTYYAHGAAMIVKRDLINVIGMLPEVFFLYYEELDWSSKARKAGFNIYYQSSAVIFHKESISIGKESALKTYFLCRNRILFMYRNFSSSQFCLFLTYFIIVATPNKILRLMLNRQYDHIKEYLKAIIWSLKNLAFNQTNLA